MTHERGITEPVDLCTPAGDALNPAAWGWSRRPLHRANLDGHWGQNMRWGVRLEFLDRQGFAEEARQRW